MNFNELGLSAELLQAVADLGFETPTEIQEKAIPVLLGKDTDFGAKVRFVLSTEPVESDSETESTEEVTDATEMSTVPVSESPDSSETQPSDGQGRQPMVLWPFIVVLGVLVAGLGVLIFFIVRLLKKSGSEEGEDGEEEEEE